MSSKRTSNANQMVSNAASSTSASNATHIHASSIAIPNQANIDHLESQLTLLSQRVAPLLDRDVILTRIDDSDPSRIELEANDSSYAPMRRARVQSRLHALFTDGKMELRAYSQAQGGGASRSSDLVNIKNLIRVELNNNDIRESELLDGASQSGYPRDIGGDQSTWQQITSAMGWVPHHNVVRRGHCFTIHQDKTFDVKVFLFRLMQLDGDNQLEYISNTRILQAVILVTLPSKPDQANAEMTNLADRANNEMIRLQEALQGFVDLTRGVD